MGGRVRSAGDAVEALEEAIGSVRLAWSDERSVHLPTVLQVLTFRGERIAEITGFVTPEVFATFGLPAELR